MIARQYDRERCDSEVVQGSNTWTCRSQILKKDLADFDNEVVYNGLYNAMFGIMVGWGWTGLLATACLSGYTFTCPDDYAVQRTILFAANRFDRAVSLFHALISHCFMR